MRYLYGDATPFPYHENFIDTLVAVTDACVALLRLDDAAQRTRRAATEEQDRASGELVELDGITAAVKQVLARHLTPGKPMSFTQATAQKILQAADSQVKQARAAVVRKREAAMRDVGLSRQADAVMEVLGNFLAEHQLPNTVWRLRWKASVDGTGAEAHVHCATPAGLQAVLEVDIPEGHRWSTAVHIRDLDKDVVVALQTDRSWVRGGTKVRREHLDKFYVTEVELGPERKSMVVRRGRTDAAGVQIVVQAPDQSEPTARRLDADDAVPLSITGADAETIHALWDTVEDTIVGLVEHRRRLLLASLNGKSVRELDRPQTLAETMLEAVGPTVREMRRRSRMPGEITLKRELGCGRREELFIPKDHIALKFSSLSVEHRLLFDAFGLDATQEIVTSEFNHARRFPLPDNADDEDDEDDEDERGPTLRLITAEASG